MSVTTESGATDWIPGRGDYGAEHANDLIEIIEIIERHNCVHGCVKAGTPAAIAEYGPGGNCEVLARVFIGEPIPELDPRPTGPHCRARQDPATAGMEPLFGEGS